MICFTIADPVGNGGQGAVVADLFHKLLGSQHNRCAIMNWRACISSLYTSTPNLPLIL